MFCECVEPIFTKHEAKNSKYETCLPAGRQCIKIMKSCPLTAANLIYGKQLLRCSSSVGANYIEANESLSKKDFLKCVKIARKEAKETAYWLRLIETSQKSEHERR